MKIVELFLDDNEESGIEAISIVESPAIESDFIALKSDEVKLAEVDKEKKILMGALLIPNKPIYRKTEGEEYYIYFSKETVLKASQRYLMNGYQGNSTLEHSDNLEGLTLVESWIVEDEVQDKSRKYGLNAPVGTWMGTIKVNNDDVWNDYVKTGKVKGFSIEGFFADKIEAQKMSKEEKEAELLLSKITSIVKGERVDLGLKEDIQKLIDDAEGIRKDAENISDIASKGLKISNSTIQNIKSLNTKIDKKLNEVEKSAKELGVDPKNILGYSKLSKNTKQIIKNYTSYIEKADKSFKSLKMN